MPDDSIFPKKGQGAPVVDSPSRPAVVHEEKGSKTSRYVNLGFKVPGEFRHKIRYLAGYQNTSMVEILREAIKMYQEHYRIKAPNDKGG